MRRRIVRHFTLYLPSRVVTAVVGAASLPGLTRLLSPSEFGRLTLVLASVAGGRVLFLWIQHAIVRFHAGGEEASGGNRLRTALLVHVSASVALCVLALVAARWWAPAGSRWLPILGVCVFFVRNQYGLLTQILRARLEPERFTRFVVWEEAGGLLLGCGLAYAFGLGVLGVLAGYFVAAATALPALWRRALPRGALEGEFSWNALRRMASYGLPLTLSQGAGWALRRIDRFQIQAVYGAAAVGSYAVPYLVAQYSITLFTATLRTATLPLTAERWERHGQRPALRMVAAITRMYLLATIPMVAGLLALARPALELAGGSGHARDAGIIPWVAAGVFFLGLHQCFANAMLLAERTGAVMASVVAAALVNVVLNWWLLPRSGYPVAAVTTFVSYALLASLLALASWRQVPWPFPWRSAARALVSAAGMVVVVQWLRLHLGPMPPLLDCIVSMPAGVLLYTGFLRLTGEITLADWRAALAAGRGRFEPPQADA
jgi:O-antigen/teichoic acid export membrane protein